MITDKTAFKFEWDKGNIDKNKKHSTENVECEEVFSDKKKKTFSDKVHSEGEERFRIVGKTKLGKLLFVVFTKRKEKIRIVSCRIVNKKEVSLYEKTA